jgi:hypothetical protein
MFIGHVCLSRHKGKNAHAQASYTWSILPQQNTLYISGICSLNKMLFPVSTCASRIQLFWILMLDKCCPRRKLGTRMLVWGSYPQHE